MVVLPCVSLNDWPVSVYTCFAIPQEVGHVNDLTSRLSITFVMFCRPFE